MLRPKHINPRKVLEIAIGRSMLRPYDLGYWIPSPKGHPAVE